MYKYRNRIFSKIFMALSVFYISLCSCGMTTVGGCDTINSSSFEWVQFLTFKLIEIMLMKLKSLYYREKLIKQATKDEKESVLLSLNDIDLYQKAKK